MSEPKKFEDYTPEEIRRMNLENEINQLKLNLEYEKTVNSRKTEPLRVYERTISCIRCGVLYSWHWSEQDKRETSFNAQPFFAKLAKHQRPHRGHLLRFKETFATIQAEVSPP